MPLARNELCLSVQGPLTLLQINFCFVGNKGKESNLFHRKSLNLCAFNLKKT
jgi:hypothetical protein